MPACCHLSIRPGTDRPGHAIQHLKRALALNPHLTKAATALAFELEARGDAHASEAVLLESSRQDKQYAPAWAIANFYFRQNQPEPFWSWARAAAEKAYGDVGPLFDLCFHLTDDASTVLDRVVVPKPLVEQCYLAYLAAHQDTGERRSRCSTHRAPGAE